MPLTWSALSSGCCLRPGLRLSILHCLPPDHCSWSPNELMNTLYTTEIIETKSSLNPNIAAPFNVSDVWAWAPSPLLPQRPHNFADTKNYPWSPLSSLPPGPRWSNKRVANVALYSLISMVNDEWKVWDTCLSDYKYLMILNRHSWVCLCEEPMLINLISLSCYI